MSKSGNGSSSSSSGDKDDDDLSYNIFKGHGFAMDGYMWKGVSGTQRHVDQEAAAAAEAAGEDHTVHDAGKNNEHEEDSGEGVHSEKPGDTRKALQEEAMPCNGTALWWACVYGHLPVVQYLVQMYKPLVNVDAKLFLKSSLLHCGIVDTLFKIDVFFFFSNSSLSLSISLSYSILFLFTIEGAV